MRTARIFGSGQSTPHPGDERDNAAGWVVRGQAARVTFEEETAFVPVTIVWAAPHQQVNETTIPWSVLAIAVIWLEKMSWRFWHAVHWWSNMG
jgi:hypothetical protein